MYVILMIIANYMGSEVNLLSIFVLCSCFRKIVFFILGTLVKLLK